jgi:hypothetical protein
MSTAHLPMVHPRSVQYLGRSMVKCMSSPRAIVKEENMFAS